jgi:hypothetical protein
MKFTYHEFSSVVEPTVVTAVTVAPLVGVETVTVQAALTLPRNREKKNVVFERETMGGRWSITFVEKASLNFSL